MLGYGHEGRIEEIQEKAVQALFEIAHVLREIRDELRPKFLSRVRLHLMPKTLTVGQTANAVISAVDQFGNPFPLTSANNISVAASTPADVTIGAVSFPGDGTAVVVVTAVSADPGDGITATVDSFSATDTLVIEAPVPALAGVKLVLQ